MNRKSNRRDFLKGKAAVETLDDAILPVTDENASAPDDKETPLVHVTRRAMATEFELQFYDDPARNLTELALESLGELERVEEQLSFFRTTSEIGRVNLLADKQPIEIETELFELLTLAMQLFRETDGAWDATAAPLWQVWGFAKRKGRIPTTDELDEARRCVGSQYIELNSDRKTVYFTRPGMKLNFGSLGKGYALDRCAARLIEGGMTNFLLHGGQSSILVQGGKPVPYWPIGLPHPFCPTRRFGEIRLRNRALGTSNSRFQSFRHEGKLFGHILDPRSGRPAEGVLSATVLAPTATLADALSTAFYILGPKKTQEYCDKHAEVSALLLIPSSNAAKCEIITAGVNNEEFMPLGD